MKQIYKGKLKLRIARECPYYGTAGRTLHKVLFYKFGISVSLWIHYDTTFPEYTEYSIKKISKIFRDVRLMNILMFIGNKKHIIETI